ncbi:MAG: hypothetical protein AAB152_15710, partial [Candidatus Coatesbacteria bacterium]
RAVKVEAARTALVARIRPLLADPAVEIDAPSFVVSSIAKAAGKPRVFLVNVNGIRPAHAVTPAPVSGIKVSFAAGHATRIRLLPFMGKVTDVKTDRAGGRLSAVLPPIDRGAIVWCQ